MWESQGNSPELFSKLIPYMDEKKREIKAKEIMPNN